jgi:hypothetical protein
VRLGVTAPGRRIDVAETAIDARSRSARQYHRATTCDDGTGMLLVCDASGMGTPVACPLGCHPTIERYDLNPSNSLTACPT